MQSVMVFYAMFDKIGTSLFSVCDIHFQKLFNFKENLLKMCLLRSDSICCNTQLQNKLVIPTALSAIPVATL